jgi:hypothetical protein
LNVLVRRKVGILSIQGDQFDIEPVVLKTVRPFKIGEIVMEEEADDPANDLDLQLRDSVTAFLEKKVRKTPLCKSRRLLMPLDRLESLSQRRERNGKH